MSKFKIDPVHSEIKFKVKHLVVSNVTGEFKQFDASIESDRPDFTDAKIVFTAEIASLETGNEQRDGHLKSPDFFDAANYPKMSFNSRRVTKLSETDYRVVGDLTIRNVTKEIELNIVYNGTAKGFGGTEVLGFEATGKINRFEFGLKWNGLTEAGGIVVGEDVRIEITAEFNRIVEVQKAA